MSSPIPSATVLEETPARALAFLRGLGRSPLAHGQLEQAGYRQVDHEEGWQLLFKAAGYAPGVPDAPDSTGDDAIVTLDAWDENGFARIRAALDRLHPEQSSFVFAGDLEAESGPKAVIGVKTLLDRLDMLDSGKGRPKSAHKADAEAIATLERRGIGEAERARLRALVEEASALGPSAPIREAVQSSAARKEARTADLAKLHAWYKDWTTTARSVIKQRSSLIALGLANRRARARTQPPAPAPGPVSPATTAPASVASS